MSETLETVLCVLGFCIALYLQGLFILSVLVLICGIEGADKIPLYGWFFRGPKKR